MTAAGEAAVVGPAGTRRGTPMSTQDQRRPVEVPGTPIFDGQSSRRGLRMNKMFMSFRDEASRTRFLADEVAYCQEYGLTPEQQQAVVDRDWPAMIDLGGSIFYVFKLAMIDGRSMQYLGGVFTGMSEDEFVAAMRAGGRRDG